MNAISPPPATPQRYSKPSARLWKLIARHCLIYCEMELEYDDRFFLQTILALGRISPQQWHRMLDIAFALRPSWTAETLRIADGEA
jgi:hypothetical protein